MQLTCIINPTRESIIFAIDAIEWAGDFKYWEYPPSMLTGRKDGTCTRLNGLRSISCLQGINLISTCSLNRTFFTCPSMISEVPQNVVDVDATSQFSIPCRGFEIVLYHY